MYLVTGATGNVGAAVVRALADAGHPVRGVVRDPDRATLPDGVTAMAGDLNRPETLGEALDGARGVFLLPGYADMPGVLALARRSGVEHVVQLSGSSVETGDMTNAVTAYMTRSEAAVHAGGLPWTILRPSAFMSNTFEWAPQLRAGDVVRAPFADVAAAVIDPADIGAVAALALTQPGHDGRTYRLTGPEPMRPVDRVRVLADALGRDLRFEAQSNQAARAEMSASMPAEYVEAFFDFYVKGSLDESPVLPTVGDLTGRPPRTFAQWVDDHLDAFRPEPS
jgi:uncharacterized protein YbjT (DUF2867 family)